MPIISVQMFDGRTIEQKRAFVKAITEASCNSLNCSADSVTVVIHEVKRENWGTAGALRSDPQDA